MSDESAPDSPSSFTLTSDVYDPDNSPPGSPSFVLESEIENESNSGIIISLYTHT